MEIDENDILEEAFDLTVNIMTDFVLSQNLHIAQIVDCNIDALKSFCQGYFCAMFVRNVTMVGFKHNMGPHYQPLFSKYDDYYIKLCNHTSFLKILNNIK